jgi:hypothetical protein
VRLWRDSTVHNNCGASSTNALGLVQPLFFQRVTLGSSALVCRPDEEVLHHQNSKYRNLPWQPGKDACAKLVTIVVTETSSRFPSRLAPTQSGHVLARVLPGRDALSPTSTSLRTQSLSDDRHMPTNVRPFSNNPFSLYEQTGHCSLAFATASVIARSSRREPIGGD